MEKKETDQSFKEKTKKKLEKSQNYIKNYLNFSHFYQKLQVIKTAKTLIWSRKAEEQKIFD